MIQEPIVESYLENCVDSQRNSTQYERNTEKLHSLIPKPKKPMNNRLNLYDKYKEKNQNKKPEKFKFPSPEKTQKKNAASSRNREDSNEKTQKRNSFRSPEKTKNLIVYNLNCENSDFLSKIISNPMSTKMRENAKNPQLFNSANTEISGCSLKSTITPQTKNLDSCPRLCESETKNIKLQRNYESAQKERDHKKKINNSFHVENPREKNFFSSEKNKKNDEFSTFHSDDEMETIKKSQKTDKNNQKKVNFGDFYSVTSKNPEILIKQAENSLKALNFALKYVKIVMILWYFFIRQANLSSVLKRTGATGNLN